MEPLGIKTPFVESLTSYISRLAECHSVSTGTLISKKLAPLYNRDYLLKIASEGGTRFYESSVSINGVGVTARDCVKALSALTLRQDLEYTTLLFWGNLLPTKGLLSSKRTWCPICFQDWLQDGKVIYEPLLWSLKAVTVCPVHNVYLINKCPNINCGRGNLVLNRSSRPGFCSACGCWLGMADNHGNNRVASPSDEELQWRKFVGKSIGQLLEITPDLINPPDGEMLIKNLNSLLKVCTDGNITVFAKMLNISKVSLWSWCHGENRLSMEGLLHICYSTQIPLLDLITKEICENKNYMLLHRENKKASGCPRRAVNHLEMKESLRGFLLNEESPPPSMREVARRLGYDKRLLYNHCPDLCKEISSRYLRERAVLKDQRINNACSLVQKVSLELIQKGIYPSRRKVEERIEPRGILREKVVQDVWHAIIKNIDKF